MLVGPPEERGKLSGKENGRDGVGTKTKRKTKTEKERLYTEWHGGDGA